MNSAVTFQRENFAAVIDEALPLLGQHYAEVGHNSDVPLNIDKAKYEHADLLGILRVYTARKKDALIGYLAFFLTKHQQHMGRIVAIQDALYVMPVHRGFGSDLVQFANDQLQGESIDFVWHSVKKSHDFSPMLERIGFKHIESLYEMRLDLPKGLGNG